MVDSSDFEGNMLRIPEKHRDEMRTNYDRVATIVDTQMQVFDHPATMLKDVRFELTADVNGSGMQAENSGGGGNSGNSGDDEPRP